MASLTRDDEKLAYSHRETALLNLLVISRGQRITTNALAELLFEGDRIFHQIEALNNILRALCTKVEYNNEPFRILRKKGKGPYPAKIWIEDVTQDKETGNGA